MSRTKVYSKSTVNKKTKKNQQKQKKTSQKSKKEEQKQQNITDDTQKCGICLQDLGKYVSTLNCGHKFCSQECSLSWWQGNQMCPYCRKFIQFIHKYDDQLIFRQQIPQKSQPDDNQYIDQCYQCRADIQKDQNYFICCDCSRNVVHDNCLVFRQKSWMCFECSQNYIDGDIIYPIIKFNPVIQFLFSKFKIL